MIRANKHDRQFRETSWMNYIDKNKFKREIYKEFWDMYWISITWKLKRKLKSVQHYLINPDNKQRYKKFSCHREGTQKERAYSSNCICIYPEILYENDAKKESPYQIMVSGGGNGSIAFIKIGRDKISYLGEISLTGTSSSYTSSVHFSDIS